MLHDGKELAVLDVQEEGEFAKGHLLYASNFPYSHIELIADDLLPRRSTRIAPLPSAQGLSKAKVCSERIAERFGVKRTDHTTLDSWRDENAFRTLYIVDVRLSDEFEAGHMKGSRNVPGGQLVQETDKYLPVRNARVVLVDDNEVRAIVTASWLIQMGWDDVYVLQGGIVDTDLIQGKDKPLILGLEKNDTFLCWN